MKRRRMRAGCCESCDSLANPLTTFTTEQALWLAGGGVIAAGVFGYLLYTAGKTAQQIADMQAYQAGTFGQPATPATPTT